MKKKDVAYRKNGEPTQKKTSRVQTQRNFITLVKQHLQTSTFLTGIEGQKAPRVTRERRRRKQRPYDKSDFLEKFLYIAIGESDQT